jgi:hypothetical protein
VLPDATLDALRARLRPFEEAEVALVHAVVSERPWLSERDENALRYALNLARVSRVRTPDGDDLDLEPALVAYRAEVAATALPLLLRRGGVDHDAVGRLVPHLEAHARAVRARLGETFGAKLPAGALDREICEKALVLVAGGGGGVGWSYLGAFELLERYGLVPRLMAGTSMGAILLLFRARRIRYQPEDITEVLKGLSFRGIFRLLQTDSRYGLPAAMRLYLRAAVGEFLKGPDGHPLTLDQLAIPFLVAVTGIRNGALPRDPSYYEHLLDLHDRAPRPHAVKRIATDLFQAVGELIGQRDRFARIYLGGEPETRAFDAIDAVGFSSALPGAIHYDVLREDERMHAMLGALLRRHDVVRLVDGGLVDNLPARAAWGEVMSGRIGTRNAFVLALEGFGPKLTQPLWFGLEQLAAQNVLRNRPFIHHLKSFQRVLSPIDLVPSEGALARAIHRAKSELAPDLPLVARLCRPFPALEGEAPVRAAS